MNSTTQDHSHIQGWGADLDRSMRPGVPMERTPPRIEAPDWEQPESQVPREEILVSLERPDITPVFGTSVPPSGLSGKLRRKAFAYTENNIKHWLMLVAADRVNVLEGRAEDFRQLPRNRPMATLALVGGVALLGLWIQRSRRQHDAESVWADTELGDPSLGDRYLDHAT